MVNFDIKHVLFQGWKLVERCWRECEKKSGISGTRKEERERERRNENRMKREHRADPMCGPLVMFVLSACVLLWMQNVGAVYQRW